jgi:hypothetical protein
MPPRRSARVVEAAERASGAFAVLPPALTLHILSLLPVDARLLAAAVCRGWRAQLAERTFWTRLDVSSSSGITRVATDALLRAASARAQGALRSLDVTGCQRADLSDAAVLAVARANAATLAELQLRKTGDLVATPTLEDWNEAAPNLTCLGIDARCPTSLAPALLRNEGVTYAAIRIRSLTLDDLFDGSDEADVLGVCGDVAAHASVSELCLRGFRVGLSAAALRAVADAAATLRLRALRFTLCALGGGADGGAALARALRSCDTLATLALKDTLATPAAGAHVLDAPGAAALGEALRENGTLTRLSLLHAGLFRDAAAGVTLLGACVGHASLQRLEFADNEAPAAARVAVGAALAALLAANEPALTHLDVSGCLLGDEGLRPLLEALRRNTHLRVLDVSNNRLSAGAARSALAPAARRCGSLTELRAGGQAQACEATRDAEALVAARRGDAAA